MTPPETLRLSLATILVALSLLVVASTPEILIGQTKRETSTSTEANKLYFPPKDGDWEQLSISDSGWNQKELDEAIDYAMQQKSSGVLVLLGGKILTEKYGNPKSTFRYRRMKFGETSDGRAREDVASVQKSVAAILLGVCLDKDLVNLDDPVHKHLGIGWSNADQAVESKINLKHVISMTTGLTDELKFSAEPGTVWKYNTNAYSRIMKVLESATNMDRNELTQKWLEPLGLNDTSWEVRKFAKADPKTNRYGLVTTTRDLGRLGLLVLADGSWKNQSIVENKDYLKAMASPSQTLNPSYGYLWWLNGQSQTIRTRRLPRPGSLIPEAPKDMFAAQGALGRKIYIVPSRQLVVTRMGDGTEKAFDKKFWSLLMKAAPKQ